MTPMTLLVTSVLDIDVPFAAQLNTAAVQLPIGLEDSHSGVVDVVCGRAFRFSGVKGEDVEEIAVPDTMKVRSLTLNTHLRQLIASDCTCGNLFRGNTLFRSGTRLTVNGGDEAGAWKILVQPVRPT